ncbi:hypothetical protein [Streptomyces marincola]|uniref:hypothetical protein n=1 Tax=Streptomyces marincola TaxID=2878388 RepID=UPI001CF50EC1|nr:hypothetical protein [Streptomyces marincola]UCM89204.1 hypothetical protein LC193_15320 [Streptomyces marincola]
MSEDLYRPLFPPGTELNVLQSFSDAEGGATRACRLSVDGELILYAQATGRDDFEAAVTAHDLDVDLVDAQSVAGEFEAVAWPQVAMATAPCAVPGTLDDNVIDTLTLVVEAEHPGDDDESREVLSRVIQPLFAGVLEMTPCEENASR